MKLEVLIVDDDKMILYFHKIVVEESGLSTEPRLLTDGREALDYILREDAPGKRYCILLDINMPGMNGWEFLDAVKSLPVSERIFVVMITSSIDTADRKKAATYAMMFDYLEKPVSLEGITRIKERLMGELSWKNPDS